MSRRTERVNELMRSEISEIILRDLKDPRISAMVSITEVDVSPDLARATVYLSLLGSAEDSDETFRAITSAGPFIHHELRSRLALRRTPHLAFKRDDSIERGVRLTRMIDEVSRPDAPP